MLRITIISFLLFGGLLFSQKTIQGKVVDFNTKEPLAFATIIFNDGTTGTIADINGSFFFESDRRLTKLKCSYIGYHEKSVNLTTDDFIEIALVPKENQLDQVIISSAENPANRIIRKVIKNKKINDPEKLRSFAYKSYNKIIFDVVSKEHKDSLLFFKSLKGGHVAIMESVTERKFLNPNFSNEKIIGTRVSGFKNPQFASLATDIQPFSFYGDDIQLFDINYLNPIASGSLKKYKFFLEKSIRNEKDTTHIISFEPKPNKNFQGLKGVIYVNTNKFAIQNIIASPYEKGKIDLKIQQKYELLNDSVWFPEQLNYKLYLPDYPSKKNNLIMDGKSYIYKISLHQPLQKKEFPLEVVSIESDATQKDSAFWNSNRNIALNKREKTTYKVLDSLGEKLNFERYLRLSESLIDGKIPFGPVDLDVNKTFGFNKFEGFRLGTGLYTNERFHSRLGFGGFIGYGFDDKDWKYGAEASFLVSKNKDFSIRYGYQVDLVETGSYGDVKNALNFANFRNYIGFNFDKVREHSLDIQFRSLKYLTTNISFHQSSVSPRYNSEFITNQTSFRDYKNTNLTIQLRYAYKEKIVNSFNQRFTMGSNYPVVGIHFDKGFSDVLDSDLDYHKLTAYVSHSFRTKNLGTTSYMIEGGYIDQAVPFGLLFTGDGNFDDDYPFFSKNLFQTMTPYEFVSDRYAQLFLSHNFEGLLFKIGKFQPDIVVHHNVGWGDLINDNNTFTPFNTMENVFLESGLELKSLLKFNYLNLGYLGLGVGGFYRYGFYSNEDFNDNLALKLNMSFKIK